MTGAGSVVPAPLPWSMPTPSPSQVPSHSASGGGRGVPRIPNNEFPKYQSFWTTPLGRRTFPAAHEPPGGALRLTRVPGLGARGQSGGGSSGMSSAFTLYVGRTVRGASGSVCGQGNQHQFFGPMCLVILKRHSASRAHICGGGESGLDPRGVQPPPVAFKLTPSLAPEDFGL